MSACLLPDTSAADDEEDGILVVSLREHCCLTYMQSMHDRNRIRQHPPAHTHYGAVEFWPGSDLAGSRASLARRGGINLL